MMDMLVELLCVGIHLKSRLKINLSLNKKYMITNTQKENSWEERVNERLDNAIRFNWTGGFERKFFINFIDSLLKEQREKITKILRQIGTIENEEDMEKVIKVINSRQNN